MLSSFSEVSVLMLQFLRNGLISLVVSGCLSVAGCSPAPRPPRERSSDLRPAPPGDQTSAASSSSAGDARAARSTELLRLTEELLVADKGIAGPRAASPTQDVAERGAAPTDGGVQPTDGGVQPTDGGVQPTDDGTARAALEDDPEAGDFTVPNCHGGKIVAPFWVRRVPFWAALCVHGLPKKPLKVDVGTSLVAYKDLANGDAANHYQVYYSLDQVQVPSNDKRLIWAMCGGAGGGLDSGSRVIPTHRLPAAKSRIIAEHIDMLKALEFDLVMSKQNFRLATTTANKDYFKSKIEQLDAALTDAAGLLRDAVIKENRIIFLRLQPSITNAPRPLTGVGASVVPPPRISP